MKRCGKQREAVEEDARVIKGKEFEKDAALLAHYELAVRDQ